MFMDRSIDPLTLLQTYGYRFKIEVGFRAAMQDLGTYAYHFWMKALTPIRRREGKQYLQKNPRATGRRCEVKWKPFTASCNWDTSRKGCYNTCRSGTGRKCGGTFGVGCAPGERRILRRSGW